MGFRDVLRNDGTDHEELPNSYIDARNQTVAVLSDDLHTGIHLCRGNVPKNTPAHDMYNSDSSCERNAEVLLTKLSTIPFY